MVASSIPAWIQALGALVVAAGVAGSFYHGFVVKPARDDAEDAMTKAEAAKRLAESNQDELEGLDTDLRESLDELSRSINEMVEGMDQLRRQSRNLSYQQYLVAEAINESDEAPDVPLPDEDDFLRGGGD